MTLTTLLWQLAVSEESSVLESKSVKCIPSSKEWSFSVRRCVPECVCVCGGLNTWHATPSATTFKHFFTCSSTQFCLCQSVCEWWVVLPNADCSEVCEVWVVLWCCGVLRGIARGEGRGTARYWVVLQGTARYCGGRGKSRGAAV